KGRARQGRNGSDTRARLDAITGLAPALGGWGGAGGRRRGLTLAEARPILDGRGRAVLEGPFRRFFAPPPSSYFWHRVSSWGHPPPSPRFPRCMVRRLPSSSTLATRACSPFLPSPRRRAVAAARGCVPILPRSRPRARGTSRSSS